jgi:hypothetical protein
MTSVGLRPDDRDPGGAPWPGFLHRIIQAYVEAMACDETEGGELAPPPREILERVSREFDLWARSASPSVRLGLGCLLVLVEVLPVIYLRRLTRMTRLALFQRIDFLERVERTRFGLLATAFVGLKIPLVMLTYEVGEHLAHTGFDREGLAGRRRLPTLPLPVRQEPEAVR